MLMTSQHVCFSKEGSVKPTSLETPSAVVDTANVQQSGDDSVATQSATDVAVSAEEISQRERLVRDSLERDMGVD